MTYYQESYAIEDYLDKFQILILEASYTNLYNIINSVIDLKQQFRTRLQSC